MPEAHVMKDGKYFCGFTTHPRHRAEFLWQALMNPNKMRGVWYISGIHSKDELTSTDHASGCICYLCKLDTFNNAPST